MLQPLLAEHFKLTVHREARDMDALALAASPDDLDSRFPQSIGFAAPRQRRVLSTVLDVRSCRVSRESFRIFDGIDSDDLRVW
jgi:hypothetical protein